MATVGIVSPGAMGAAIGRSLAGRRVVATLAGRSQRTRGLADRLELLPSLEDVAAAADIVFSVVPPGEALAVAEAIAAAAAATGARPLVADLNAVSPATVGAIGEAIRAAGLELVDGSISGPPPRPEGATRLYLSGPRAGELAALGFAGVEPIVVGDEVGTASALKMCTASVYKGTALLLAHALGTAQAEGVLEPVLADLRTSFPELLEGAERTIALAASKSPRYVGEMREIARTQAGAGFPQGLFDAIAAAYAAMAATELAGSTPEQAARADDLDATLRALRS
jgi:3-hydroxyisobutyrate dehydrogenase-like beta-hydroxyacid dehydrogenase